MAQKKSLLKPILCGGGLLAAAAGIFLFLNRGDAPGTADGPAASTADQSAETPGAFKPPTPANDDAHPDAVDADTALEQLMAQARANAARLQPLIDEVRRLAGTDPEGVLAWALTLEGDEAAVVLNELFTIWSRTDPKAAWAAATGLDPAKFGMLRDRSMSQVLLDWGLDDPSSAWDALMTLENTPGRGPTEIQLASMFSRRDLDGAAAALGFRAQSSENLAAMKPAFTAVGKAYATQDAGQAVTWLESLPDGPAREGAIAGIVTSWAQVDPNAAGEWLNAYPPGNTRDQGAAALTFMIEPTDPESAMAWAASISDAQTRVPIAQSMASRWLTRDSASATAWLQESTLPESEVATIFERQRQVDDMLEAANVPRQAQPQPQEPEPEPVEAEQEQQ